MLTDHASWRWCFYINLPIGAVTFLVIILLLPIDEPPAGLLTWKEKLQSMDLLGLLFLIPAILTLLLGLEWGGSQYSWDNWRVILLFVLFGVLLLVFVGIQIRVQDKATLPPRLICNRNMLGVVWYVACNSGALFVFIYYVCCFSSSLRANLAAGLTMGYVPRLATNLVPSRQGILRVKVRSRDLAYPVRAGLCILGRGNSSLPSRILYPLSDCVLNDIGSWGRATKHAASILWSG